MTARYDMYAQELADAIKPDFKPQIVHEWKFIFNVNTVNVLLVNYFLYL